MHQDNGDDSEESTPAISSTGPAGLGDTSVETSDPTAVLGRGKRTKTASARASDPDNVESSVTRPRVGGDPNTTPQERTVDTDGTKEGIDDAAQKQKPPTKKRRKPAQKQTTGEFFFPAHVKSFTDSCGGVRGDSLTNHIHSYRDI